jgi:hypothetical protein
MYLASSYNHKQVVEVLLDAGAQIDAVSRVIYTACYVLRGCIQFKILRSQMLCSDINNNTYMLK